MDTLAQNGQGPVSALRVLADNVFPEEVKMALHRKEDVAPVQKSKQGT